MNKKKRYAKGFKWGRLEHKFEKRTTRWLIVGIALLGLAIYFEFGSLFYVAFFIFVLALFFRLVSAFCHKMEKFYMDRLRFRRR